MRRIAPELRAAGAAAVVIGNGTPEEARKFLARTGLDGEDVQTFCDPGRASYVAAGLRRGVFRILRPRGLRNLVRAARAGFRQGRTQGDATQLGGLLGLAPGGKVLFRWVEEAVGDPIPFDAALAALTAGGT